jgi:uncharacterized protein (TIGR00299 family) protein
MKIAYFDSGSGISGDMTVGALLDSGRGRGLSVEALADALSLLGVPGYRIGAERVANRSITANSLHVEIDEPPHIHRDWRTIRRLIEAAGERGLSEGTVERAVRIFDVLARAEARVHGTEPEKVHFHEVGAIDSIVDIVGAAWCLDTLAIDACFVGPLPSGSGYVQTQHGRLPVPAPATALLLEGFEIVAGDGAGEMVTPTGAAILAALAKPVRPAMQLEAVGMGAGTRRWEDRPNVLRVFVGECDEASDEQVVEINADVDDMTPAALAHLCDLLRADGAREVHVTTAHMKKGRTGMRVTVLCDVDRLTRLADRMLSESSTIGLRYRAHNRIVLPRRIDYVDTQFGSVALKVVMRPNGDETAEPEFEDVARLALESHVLFADVRNAALDAWQARG